MPIYEVGEHELLKEDTTLIRGDEEISSGTLYLSDRRIIYERKGKRGVFKATSPQTVFDVKLYEVTNITTAVPRIKVMTKRTITVEFMQDDRKETARFEIDNPKEWEAMMRRWIEDSKRIRAEELRRLDDDRHRKEVEMARAKAGMTNIGMVNVDMKAPGKDSEKIFDAEEVTGAVSSSSALAPVHSSVPIQGPKRCKKCKEILDYDAKFCPVCGTSVR